MPTDDPSTSDVVAPPSAPNLLTETAYKRLVAERESLQQIQRPALEQRVRQAKLFLAPADGAMVAAVAEGDLAVMDQQIEQLQTILKNVQIIGEGPVPETVQPGWGVTVRYDDEQKLEQVLTVVGPLEADPLRGYITAESPVGRALLDKPVGAKVKAEDGTDTVELTVVSIEKARPDGEA